MGQDLRSPPTPNFCENSCGATMAPGNPCKNFVSMGANVSWGHCETYESFRIVTKVPSLSYAVHETNCFRGLVQSSLQKVYGGYKGKSSPGEQKSASGFAPIRPSGNFFLFSNANDHTKRIPEFTPRYSRPPGLATLQLRSFCFGRLAFDFR